MKFKQVWVVVRKGIPGVRDSEGTMIVSREYYSKEDAEAGLDRVQRADQHRTEYWIETCFRSEWETA